MQATLPEIKQSRIQLSKPVIAGLIAAGVLLLFGGGSFALALKNFHAQEEIARKHLDSVQSLRKSWTSPEGQPAELLDFDTVTAYVLSLNEHRAPSITAAAAIREGQGMMFWLPTRRHRSTAELDASWDREAAVAGAVQSALDNTRPAYLRVRTELQDAEKDWSDATSTLSAQSDFEDFSRATTALRGAEGTLRAEQSAIQAQLRRKSLSGMAAEFRQGLLGGMAEALKLATTALAGRNQTVEQAVTELRKHKDHMSVVVGESAHLLSGLNTVSTVLLPATKTAFEKTQGLRQFFHEAEQPFFGGEAGNMLASVLGNRQGGGPVTPLSIVTGMYPGASVVMSTLKGICDGIERINGEVVSLSGATENTVRLTRSYLNSRNRADMISLASEAPITAAYFEARRGLFDPIVNEMNKLRNDLMPFRSAVDNMRNPIAKRILGNGIGMADGFLATVADPFRRGNEGIANTAIGMREVTNTENIYVSAINGLRSQGIWPVSYGKAGLGLQKPSPTSAAALSSPSEPAAATQPAAADVAAAEPPRPVEPVLSGSPNGSAGRVGTQSLDGWEHFVDGWSVSSGVFHTSNTTPNVRTELIWRDGFSWTDYSITASIRLGGGYAPSDAELMFRYQDPSQYGACRLMQDDSGVRLELLDVHTGVLKAVPFPGAVNQSYRFKVTISGTHATCQALDGGQSIEAEYVGSARGTVGFRNAHIPVDFGDVRVE